MTLSDGNALFWDKKLADSVKWAALCKESPTDAIRTVAASGPSVTSIPTMCTSTSRAAKDSRRQVAGHSPVRGGSRRSQTHV